MKNPFLDMMRQPMSSPDKFVKLLQEQQRDTMETSQKILGCRDPMSFVSLQQEFMARMLRRWTRLATEASQEATADAQAAASATKKAAADLAGNGAARPERSAIHDAAEKASSDAKKAPVTPAPTPATVTPVAGTPKSAGGGKDDLTQIKGIGPKFAQTLNEHGIRTYADLASLTPTEIEKLEEKLGFSGRFARENWVEQARAMIAH